MSAAYEEERLYDTKRIEKLNIYLTEVPGDDHSVNQNSDSSTIARYVFCPPLAKSHDQLPDIGTSASTTLSRGQERAMGDFYVRQLRASAPLIHDSLLTQYITNWVIGWWLAPIRYACPSIFIWYAMTRSMPSPSLAAMSCYTPRRSASAITKANWLRCWHTKFHTLPNAI